MKKLGAFLVVGVVCLVIGRLSNQAPVSAESMDDECAPAPEGLACINGDVNCDGVVNRLDGIAIIQWDLQPDAPELCPLAYPPEIVAELYRQIAELEAELAQCRATPQLPTTGQTLCYDEVGDQISCDSETYPGQDGLYQTGCPNEGRFVDNQDGTVTDTCTGLMWKTESVHPPGVGLSWQQALQYCENLELAGHSDWRLPSINELVSLVDYSRSRASDPDENAISPIFGGTMGTTWSSTTCEVNRRRAWYVQFTDGYVGYGVDKRLGRHVRATRGIPQKGIPATGQTRCYDTFGNEVPCDSANYPGQDGFYQTGCPPENRFIDNWNGTVTDTCTGLMWQQEAPSEVGLTWQQALQYCENLELAGHSDWRPPNINELASLADYSRGESAIFPIFGEHVGRTWSSTSHTVRSHMAWHVNFPDGLVSVRDEKSLGRGIRAVRGGAGSPETAP